MDPNSAPRPEGTCCVEGCENQGEESWFPDHCALRDGGVEPTWKHLCIKHDLELNMFVTRMFYGDKYDHLLEAYAAEMESRRQLIDRLTAEGVQVVEL